MEDRSDRRYRSRDPLDQRIDQWVETGRQFVDGVSGRRPGQRRGPMALDSVGRWVGEKVEWLLEDDDDWRSPGRTPSRLRPKFRHAGSVHWMPFPGAASVLRRRSLLRGAADARGWRRR